MQRQQHQPVRRLLTGLDQPRETVLPRLRYAVGLTVAPRKQWLPQVHACTTVDLLMARKLKNPNSGSWFSNSRENLRTPLPSARKSLT